MKTLLAFVACVVALLAFASPASAAPSTSIRADHPRITLGHTVTISGRVMPGLAWHKVKLQKRSGKHWRTIAIEKINAKHRYWFHLRPGRAGTKQYRVLAPRRTTGGHRAVSDSVVVTVVRPRGTSSPSCTPGYSPCIPPGDDVDCASGSGNGPRYVDGPVSVTGDDIYGLDADGNGVGCES